MPIPVLYLCQCVKKLGVRKKSKQLKYEIKLQFIKLEWK